MKSIGNGLISIFFRGILFLGLIAGCGGGGGGGGSAIVKSDLPILTTIEVTPTNPAIAVGTTQRLTATGIYSDGTKSDVTVAVTWSIPSPNIATVSNLTDSNGIVTAVAPGSIVITATSGSISGTTTLTVTGATLVTIQLSPAAASVARGTNQQFTAVGIFSDNSKQDLTLNVSWSSSNQAIATIGNLPAAMGLAATGGVGTTTIAATLGAVSGSTTLTVTNATLVSIEVTPTAPSAPMGTTVQFTATGTYSDNSTQDLTGTATWSSSTPGVAAINNAGLATAIGAGTATITASLGSVTGSTTLDVTAATLVSLEVAPTNPDMPKGTTLQLTATGIYSDNTTVDLTSQTSWSSSTIATAIVSNTAGSNGLTTAVDVGTTTVTAAIGIVSGSTLITVTSAVLVTIDVTPTQPSIAQGTKQQFAATAIYSDNSTEDLTTAVTWTSSDETIANINNASGFQGQATAVAPGTTTITAAWGNVSGSTTFTVTNATLLSLEITPTTPTIPKGMTQQFTATGIYSDDTTQDLTAQATWSSSNPAVAAVSNAVDSKGLATSLVPGTTTIRATMSGMAGSTTLTVTPDTLVSIAVTPVSASIPLGIARQYTATGTYTDGSTRDITKFVTWTSSTRSVATISNSGGTKGIATPVSVGLTTITATAKGIVSNSTP